MKNLWFVAILFTTGLAIAEDLPFDLENANPLPKKTKPAQTNRPNPCAVIERACKSAGYKEFFHRDCVKPILQGRPVKDVTTGDISLQQIKACKMYKEDNLKQ